MINRENEQILRHIDASIRGDRQSQYVLYKLFYGKMLGVCLRYARNRDEAKDILQDGFVKVFSSLSDYGRAGSFEGWVRRIMVNTAIDAFRKQARSSIFADSDFVNENAAEKAEDETEDDMQGITTADILQAVQQLSPVYRTIFNLYVMEELSHKQIADQLGISEGTSKSNYFKAKANLRRMLEKKKKHYQEF